MRGRTAILSCFTLAVLSVLNLGCAPKAHPPSLIALPGATNVRYIDHDGRTELAYQLHQVYPAKAALREINAKLARQGWKPMKEDFLNPGSPSSHVTGWGDFLDGTKQPNEHVWQWLAQWQDAQGNIVSYVLRYRSPEEQTANLKDCHVSTSYFSAQMVREIRQEIKEFMKKRKEQ